MRLKSQNIIAVIFGLLFVVSVPLVLLHTAGYRINLRTRRLEHTGLLLARSTPRDAAIFLDGVPQPERTPARLSLLLPREYVLRVEKNGYQAWSKTVRVESNRTTFADDILLFSSQLPELIDAGEVLGISVGPDGTRATALSVPGFVEFWFAEPNRAPRLAGRVESVSADAVEMFWSNSGRRVLVTIPSAEPIYIILDHTGSASATTLETDGKPLSSAAWTAEPLEELLTVQDGQAMLWSIGRSAVPFSLNHTDRAWFQNGTFFLAEAATSTIHIWRYAQNGDRDTLLTDLPVAQARFLPTAPGVLTLGDSNRLWVLDGQDGHILLEQQARGSRWSTENENLLLLWSDFELWVWDKRDNHLELLTRFGSPIRDAAWYPGTSHVVVAVGDTVMAIERADRFGRLTTPLFSLPGLRGFAVNPRTQEIISAASPGGRAGLYRFPILVP